MSRNGFSDSDDNCSTMLEDSEDNFDPTKENTDDMIDDEENKTRDTVDWEDDDIPEKPAPKSKSTKPTKDKDAKTSKKSSKDTSSDTPVKDIAKEKERIKIPEFKEFISSPIVESIKWLIDKCHVDDVKPKKLSPKATEQKAKETPLITTKDFKSKQFMEKFYNMFIEAYKVRKSFRDNFGEKSTVCRTTKDKTTVLRLKEGKTVILEASEEDIKALDNFDEFVTHIYANINVAKLKENIVEIKSGKEKQKEISIKDLLEFCSLKINDTINAYDISKKYKHMVDFVKFEYVYDEDMGFSKPEFDKKEIISLYHELFSEKVYNKPSEVFKRRVGIIKNNDDINMNRLIKDVHKHLSSKKQHTELSEFWLNTILTRESYKRIIADGYPVNIILTRAFTRLFDSKPFSNFINEDLQRISFLFTPFCFYSEQFKKEIEAGRGGKTRITDMSLQGRRKAMIETMTGEDDNILKSKNYWTGVIKEEPEENHWFKNKSDEQRESKISENNKKQTNKSDTSKDDDKMDSDTSTKSKASRKSTKSTSSKKSSKVQETKNDSDTLEDDELDLQ